MRVKHLAFSSALLALPLLALLMAYPDGPDPKLTGGFGEENCTGCHSTAQVNAGRLLGGVFRIEGVPRDYTPGQTYPLKVVIGQPRQSRWGFQLTARRADSGTQAGLLKPSDSTSQAETDEGVQYLMHTLDGTRWGTLHGPVEFLFEWTAPDSGAGLVIFNAAGNAADGSDDERGDFIYTAGEYSLAAGQIEVAPLPEVAVQEESRRRRVETPVLVQFPTPVDRRKGDFEVQIQHIFRGGIDSGLGEAFGADRGANINLGLGYSISDRFSAAVTRERDFKIVTFSGTYEIHHSQGSPWSMDIHAGLEATDNFERHYSPFIQVATALDYRRLRIHATPTLILNSRVDEIVDRFPAALFVNPGDNHTFSLGLGADVALSPSFSVIGEVIPRLAGFGGIRDLDDPAYSAGIKLRSRGHVFTIFVSKSIDFTPAVYGVNANRLNDDVSLGFNIYRRIR